ncbi:SDR family oxidoreductase [Paenibacillus motobuensis]|uniref:SDR family oxidoreductase n=1 Tax=Paenibacillus TaxID=44249 RepID=UPI0020412986|nr:MULTISPECIES: SDR family NAD(P)-dependent oxidoreductase [Paenibacillus]MCM3038129.1 SDR family oxidoreductase [Paenibacillus lutimineralis]MCM3645233.1 SDR family oxidoreductase [Paenibacillus motobuensis]
MTENLSKSGRFSGRTALITGAGSGIGRAAALKLAGEGANVALFDLIDERTRSTERHINEVIHGHSRAFDVDVADPVRVEQAVKEVATYFGGIDIVFANAGINGVLAPVEELSFDDWERTISINLGGTFLTVKHSVPYLKQKDSGSIIITSSINGNDRFSGFGMSAYSTTKAGQVAFAKMMALELAKYKIRVNVICPGAISTNIDSSTEVREELKEIVIPVEYPEGSQPLADGPGQPAQVADLVAYLASDESSHITGARIVIDGAESLL